MDGPLILSLFFAAMLVWALAVGVVAVTRQTFVLKISRLAAMVLCQLIATLCLYGLAASFEPGVPVTWKLGYAIMVLLMVGSAGKFSLDVLQAKLHEQ